jgi:hypothetical protein
MRRAVIAADATATLAVVVLGRAGAFGAVRRHTTLLDRAVSRGIDVVEALRTDVR